METKRMFLGDIVGHDRAVYVAAKALERIRREINRGTLAKGGEPLTFESVDAIIAEYESMPSAIAASEYEVMVGVTFFFHAFPDVRPTAKGDAKIDLMIKTVGAGHG